MNYLNREAAAFGEEIWSMIDSAAVGAARDLLTGRRFLEVDGPYGLGMTAVEVGEDGFCRQPEAGEAGAVLSRAISVPMLRRSCQLSIRRIEGYRHMNQPLNLAPVEDAAEAIARREEEFIYYGQKDFGLPGLLTADGRRKVKGGDWKDTSQALDDVLAAVNALDGEGFRGPYALALSPPLYNGLFRRYEGTDMLQLEHLQRLCPAGVYKAPIDGAVLLDPRAGRLLVGQDLTAGYSGQDGIHHDLYLCESMVLMLESPEAVCTIDGVGGKKR